MHTDNPRGSENSVGDWFMPPLFSVSTFSLFVSPSNFMGGCSDLNGVWRQWLEMG
ncbi:hypothetical protein HanIR_Chr17g0875311 [Helianthus annuus]|nr:hypothetical protein HanIR_Chr17g0875311 [Helianthus annuus]